MSESSHHPPVPKLCSECKEMFGSAAFKDMCSKCYKKSLDDVDKHVELILKRSNTAVSSSKTAETPAKCLKIERKEKEEKGARTENELNCGTEEQQIQKPAETVSRCHKCSKRVGLLGFSCSHCSEKHCKFHRLPEDHDCAVDFVGLGRKKLKLENPLVESHKIEKI